MKLMVCGGRDIKDRDLVRASMERTRGFLRDSATPRDWTGACVLHGGARGVDQIADVVARTWGWDVKPYPPNYEEYPPMLAPKIRNIAMVKDADCVLAIWDWMSGGTAHAIAVAAALGKPLRVELTQELP